LVGSSGHPGTRSASQNRPIHTQVESLISGSKKSPGEFIQVHLDLRAVRIAATSLKVAGKYLKRSPLVIAEVRTYFQARPTADAYPGLLHMLNKFLGSFDSHLIELPMVVAML
jgi:hypothetical protein